VWKRVLTRNAVGAYGVEEGIDVHVLKRVLMKGWGKPKVTEVTC
jgi:hypothetical protein